MFTKEDYVSLETAKLLKEKGFDEYCGAYYHLNWDDMTEDECFEVATDKDFKNSNNVHRVGAPALYEAQKWLLEKHNLFVEITAVALRGSDSPCGFSTNIFYKEDSDWELCDCLNEYISYQEALDAGIQEALKLI